MRSHAAFLWLLILVMSICSCRPSLQVSSDHDKRVDFNRYKTFGFYVGARNNISRLNLRRIYNAVKAEMLGKGLTEDSLTPELLVHVSAILKRHVEVYSITNYYGYGSVVRPYYWGEGMPVTYTTYDLHHYKTGSLIIDLVDGSSKKLVWQGIGNGRLDRPVDDADHRIPGAIDKIMADFPPKPGE
jgi:hypothetical protein